MNYDQQILLLENKIVELEQKILQMGIANISTSRCILTIIDVLDLRLNRLFRDLLQQQNKVDATKKQD